MEPLSFFALSLKHFGIARGHGDRETRGQRELVSSILDHGILEPRGEVIPSI